MSHYEERLEKDLGAIRKRVKAIAARIERALKDSVHALISGDRDHAALTILGDLPINREIREIDRRCHAFVARHLPSAGHLRFISSVLRLNVALERVGDYAVAIARETVQVSGPPPASVLRDIELIADQARRIFGQAMKAFNEGNADLAKGTKGMAGQVNSTFQKIFADLLREGEKDRRPVKDLFAMLVVINRLGRVSDQAKNICEETIFAETGETKEPKVYRVLFVEEGNDCLSQIAEAFARKAFPESGAFSSASWAPAGSLDPQCALFLERNGFDLADLDTEQMTTVLDELADYHVIVSLQGDVRPHLPSVPFHTTLLSWDVGPPPAGLDEERSQAMLAESFKRISHKVQELMETLRGEGAS